ARKQTGGPMSKAAAGAAIAVLSWLSPSLFASTVAGPFVNPGNGHSYYVLSANDWTSSEQDAESLGGHLTTIRSAAENSWIVSNICTNLPGGPDLSHTALWIGIVDPSHDAGGGTHESNFVWADAEPVTYTNWNPREPNNNEGNEFYGCINWHLVY